MEKKITVPLTSEVARSLRAGDNVLISGYIYTARDAAHAKMVEMLEMGEPLPFDIKNQVIYYVGPTPAKPGQVIGSCGPTTSSRMDKYSPRLLDLGLLGMIGKGNRKEPVIESIKKNGCVYMVAIGGAGALIAKSVKKVEPIAFPELGAEAIVKLYVEDFPAIVAIDCEGNNLYIR